MVRLLSDIQLELAALVNSINACTATIEMAQQLLDVGEDYEAVQVYVRKRDRLIQRFRVLTKIIENSDNN